jgi:hypothetical protein
MGTVDVALRVEMAAAEIVHGAPSLSRDHEIS